MGLVADQNDACIGDGQHEEIDGDQIEREQPGGGAQLLVGAVFDDGDVELPRQHQDRDAAEHGQHDPGADAGRVGIGGHDLRIGHRGGDQVLGAAEIDEGDGKAHGQEGEQLDDRFDRHRQDQPVLVFGRIGMACAEQDREQCQQQGDQQRDVADEEIDRGWIAVIVFDHQADRAGDRLQLQRDIGHVADRGDQRRDGGDGEALAVAGGKEIGAGGDVFGLGQPHHPAQQRIAEQEDQYRSDIDRQELEAAFGGKADRPEEGPGRAIDRQAERVDIGSG